MKGNVKMKPMFPTSQQKPQEAHSPQMQLSLGEDCALRTLYQVVVNNLIPPYLDIPMDPIRI